METPEMETPLSKPNPLLNETLPTTQEQEKPAKMKRKPLNNLSTKEWIKFTKSWFIMSGKIDREKTAAHPATFPEELPTEFIQFFTCAGESVLDPSQAPERP